MNIVECGILDGFSLETIYSNFSSLAHFSVDAYDIFDKFNGNHAKRDFLDVKFTKDKYPNLKIQDGDFYKVYKKYEDQSIDILHVDIANNGDTYQFVFDRYMSKMKKNGIILLEGGSEERDNIEWMKKYDKPKIKPIIEKYQQQPIYSIKTFGKIPSLTLVQKK
jgi:hypothetical protein